MVVDSLCDRSDHISLQFSRNRKHLCDDLQLDGRVSLAIGLHPKQIAKQKLKDDVRRMRVLLDLPQVVAFGEVGLDTSRGDSLEEQLDGLDYIVKGVWDKLVPPTGSDLLPVVLHYRGQGNTPAVGARLRAFLVSSLDQSHPLQLHYFTGSNEEVHAWLQAFPNAYFSVGGSLFRSNLSNGQRRGVSAIPDKRLLLETDAPADPALPELKFSGPYTIWAVAEVVAQLRKSSVDDILRLTTANALRLFKGRRD
jgi:Tat protein secretion system quality control protein TatD with DNase activity